MRRTLAKIDKSKIYSWETIKFLNIELKKFIELKINKILVIAIGPIFYLFLKIIKPIKFIRIGEIETRLIGHYSFQVDLYLAEKNFGVHEKTKSKDIFFKNKIVANNFLFSKWKKYFSFGPRIILYPLFHYMLEFKPKSDHLVPYRHWKTHNNDSQFLDIYNVLDKSSCYLRFTKEEINLCNQKLFQCGIEDKDQIICFHVRDPYYRGGTFPKYGVRDSPIEIFEPAMLYLANKGYKVIRVGRKVHKAVSISHENIFDYATSNIQSDMMDIYLMSRAFFVVGTLSGLEMVAKMFRKKVCVLNVAEWRGCDMYPTYIPFFLPKIFKWKKTNKLLTISEIVKTGAYLFSFPHHFEKAGIYYEDNSPEDILYATQEMLAIILDEENLSTEENDLQKKFWSLIPARNNLRFSTKISTRFLTKHKEILT